VQAIDKRFLARWQARRRVPALRQMGIDEIYLVILILSTGPL